MPKWVRITMIAIIAMLLAFGLAAMRFHGVPHDGAVVVWICCMIIGLIVALCIVISSQLAASKTARHRVAAWKQLLLGVGIVVALALGWGLLYLVAGQVLPTVKLSTGLFLVATLVTGGFFLLFGFLVWRVASRFIEDVLAAEDVAGEEGETPNMARKEMRSELVGWRFWMWFAAAGCLIFFFFGLFEEFAPYAVIGVSKGAYLTTLYGALFVFALYRAAVSLFRRDSSQK